MRLKDLPVCEFCSTAHTGQKLTLTVASIVKRCSSDLQDGDA